MEFITFGIINSKSRFLKKLDAGNISKSAIVLIQDTRELWVHGTYIGAGNIDLCNNLDMLIPGYALDATQGKILKDMVLELSKMITTDLIIDDATKRSHVPLTQKEYDLRKKLGLLSDDVFYYIFENDDEDTDENDEDTEGENVDQDTELTDLNKIE